MEVQLHIRKIGEADLVLFEALIVIFRKEFEVDGFKAPRPSHLQKLLSREDFGVFVAELNGELVGGLTVHVLQQYYSAQPQVYLYDLAVDHNHQRKGVGGKLIEEVCRFYKEKGFEEVFVQADQEDSHAIDFYRKRKPSKDEEVFHFSYKLN